MHRVEAFAEKVQAMLKTIDVPGQLLFWGSKLKVLLNFEQETLVEQLNLTYKTTEELFQVSNSIATQFAIETPTDFNASSNLLTVLALAYQSPDLKGMNIKSEAWILRKNDVEEILSSGKSLTALHEKYNDIFLPEAWNQNVLEIRQNLLAHGNKWYKFLISDYKKSSAQLASLCKSLLPKENNVKIEYVDDILKAKRLETTLNEHDQLIKILFNEKWKNIRTDWETLSKANEYLLNLHQQIVEQKCPKEILDYLEKNISPDIAKTSHKELSALLSAEQKQIEATLTQLAFDEIIRFKEGTLLSQSFNDLLSLISIWINKISELHYVISWNNLVETAVNDRVDFLTSVASYWNNAKDFLKHAIQKSWYEFLLQQAFTSFPSLRKFQRDSHEEIIQQFRALDTLNLHYNRGRVALKHWENFPNMQAGGQVGVLRLEFNKRARLKPIRKIIEEAGQAVQQIKPVFMMSPLSIANFLPPGSVEFDIVIFDEASQVRPVEALGAILRAKQLVVVGDKKQLPPTNFFESLTKETDEDENQTADLESILGMCDSKGCLSKMLRWHYRSLHESLISFSNNEFYENKLVIFPSPGSKYRMGIIFHHLENTYYDRGKTRTNAKEAEIVAEAVIEHARKNPKQSLGVVAFSTAQRQCIQDALEIKRRKNPDVEAYFKSHPAEPFFIKNLENVQGDERDIIYISIGYGRSEDGYLAMSFGPINNEGGEKRLNVLITRAKLRCEIFTNITSDDIDLNRTQKYGIRVLKEFLYFAEHGKLNITEETDLPEDSYFEAGVSKVGSRIRDCLMQAAHHLKSAKRIKMKGEFLWMIEMEKPIIRNRINLANSARKIKLIAPEEISLSIEKVVKDSIAIQQDDLATLVGKMFGFNRVTEDMKEEILLVLQKMVKQKVLKKEVS